MLLVSIARRIEKLLGLAPPPAQPVDATILEAYVRDNPSPQHALKIFQGEWASQLPGEFSKYKAGTMPLFQDPRLQWAIGQFGGVKGKKIVELGPLEGAHTWMLEQAGAESILAIEANTRAYLKCLVVKEVLGMSHAKFLCGSFVEYLKSTSEKFDACLASGVLYHMQNPVEVIALISKVADQVYIWSHYYDLECIRRLSSFEQEFPESKPAEFEGYRFTLNKKIYSGFTLTTKGFCGGSEPFANWLTKDDLLGALRHFGFTNIEIHFDKPDHQNGPNISLVARKG